jgi:hypothetical protein
MLNKDHLPLLKVARKRVAAGRDEFICHAIDSVADSDTCQIKDYISDQIDGYCSMSSWLAAQLGLGPCWSDEPPPYNTIYAGDVLGQQIRLAWLDRLIDNLENDYEITDV